MITTAIPVFGGRCLRSWVIAANPPADAPIPTTGKGDTAGGVPALETEAAFGLTLRAVDFLDFDDLAMRQADCSRVSGRSSCLHLIVGVCKLLPCSEFGHESVELRPGDRFG